MSERLTDEDLIDLLRDNDHQRGDAYATAAEVFALATECRAHRSTALTVEEMADLREFVDALNSDIHAQGDSPIPSPLAIRALHRLTAGKP